jgi:hypothetical protein
MKYQFTGHETFPCRYSWLPKAYSTLKKNSHIFSNEKEAMTALGVGNNMVRAIRFWAQVTGLSEHQKDGSLNITRFGETLFGKKGFDPFLEDIRTLWLIHWKLSTNVLEPLFAWDYLLNRWQHPEIIRETILKCFKNEAERENRKLSPVTLEQHFDIFLHTYFPTRGRKGDIQEDNLDCPLVELELIRKVGERRVDKTGKREIIYSFNREPKLDITPELFVYCLDDFWGKKYPNEKTLSFRDVSISPYSPGMIFKLPEIDIRERLEKLETDSQGAFQYKESVSIQQISRCDIKNKEFLSAIYKEDKS